MLSGKMWNEGLIWTDQRPGGRLGHIESLKGDAHFLWGPLPRVAQTTTWKSGNF